MKKSSRKIKIKKVKKAKEFNSLTPSEKRVVIAKDVIQQIKIGRYIANSGSYIERINFNNGMDIWDMEMEDVKTNFKKIEKCNVCAMGACLMSATKFNNKLDFGDLGDSVDDFNERKVKQLFSDLFSPEQLLLIETAFEGSNDGASRFAFDIFKLPRRKYEGKKILEAPQDFRDSYGEDEKRLIAIMRNIIKNKGTFKP